MEYSLHNFVKESISQVTPFMESGQKIEFEIKVHFLFDEDTNTYLPMVIDNPSLDASSILRFSVVIP